jgi:hypothetical protein
MGVVEASFEDQFPHQEQARRITLESCSPKDRDVENEMFPTSFPQISETKPYLESACSSKSSSAYEGGAHAFNSDGMHGLKHEALKQETMSIDAMSKLSTTAPSKGSDSEGFVGGVQAAHVPQQKRTEGNMFEHLLRREEDQWVARSGSRFIKRSLVSFEVSFEVSFSCTNLDKSFFSGRLRVSILD